MHSFTALIATLVLATACSKKEDLLKEVDGHADKACAATDYKSGRKAWTDFLGFLDAHKDAKELDGVRAQIGPAIIDPSAGLASSTGAVKRILECTDKVGALR